jgi:localization factor PodJL
MATETAQSNPSQTEDPRTARSTILAAARTVHARDGAASVSFANVATQAGQTSEHVAAHFQNPQEILMALAAEDMASLARAMQGEDGKPAAPAKSDAAPAPNGIRKKVMMSPSLEQVMKDVAPDNGKEVISGAMARLERRMQVMEKAFADIVDRHDKSVRERSGAISSVEESVSAILARLDAGEKHDAELISEMRAAFDKVALRFDEHEAQFQQQPQSPSPMPMAIPAPMTADLAPVNPQPLTVPGALPAETQMTLPIVQADAKADEKNDFGALPTMDKLIPGEPPKLAQLGDAKPDRKDTYLSAARRAALAAAENDNKTNATAIHQKRTDRGSRARFLLFACLAPVAILGTAFVVLNRNVVTAGTVEPQPALTVQAAIQPPESLSIPVPQEAPADQIGALPQQAATTPVPQPAPDVVVSPAAEPSASQIRISASLQSLTQAAEAGDQHAMRDAGLKYLAGDGVHVNQAEAARWLMRASYKGEPVAQYWLATLYARGQGVPADAFQANHWYEAAAKQGNRRAMHSLAVASYQGWGMDKNPEQAAKWFQEAAGLGLVDSQFNLAVLYERGDGVPQSLVEAYKWYAIAAGQGDKEAEDRVAILATQLKPEELQKAQAAAAGFKPKPMNETANLTTGPAQLPGG